MSIDKMTFKEIQLLKRNIDYADYLNRSEPIKDLGVSISAFELNEHFSTRLNLVLGEHYFDRIETSLKEKERFIKELQRFPKLRVFKSIDGQPYKVVRVIRHSTRILEVKLFLDNVENTTLEDLPYRIRWVWDDIVNRLR